MSQIGETTMTTSTNTQTTTTLVYMRSLTQNEPARPAKFWVYNALDKLPGTAHRRRDGVLADFRPGSFRGITLGNQRLSFETDIAGVDPLWVPAVLLRVEEQEDYRREVWGSPDLPGWEHPCRWELVAGSPTHVRQEEASAADARRMSEAQDDFEVWAGALLSQGVLEGQLTHKERGRLKSPVDARKYAGIQSILDRLQKESGYPRWCHIGSASRGGAWSKVEKALQALAGL